jgi:small subunit ribosomal protein S2
MPEISMKNMLEAGVHFGHQTHRWNPKMKQFIFGPRNGIYIIDLEKTVKHAKDSCQYIKAVVAEGGKVLFVATKKQARDITRLAAEKAGMPYVIERWLGGTLTNFATIRKGVEQLEQIENWKVDGTYAALPKKEVVSWERKRKKLEQSLGGIRSLKSLPSVLFIIDPENEKIAVKEANRLGIPVVAIVDTNCNPDPIDFIIPGNDDAIKSVTLFTDLIAQSCLEGAEVYEQKLRLSGVSPEQAAHKTAEAAQEGPVVEKVVKRQLKIPTEIDYRIEGDEEVVEEKVEDKTESDKGE